jgi:hypothetical protein
MKKLLLSFSVALAFGATAQNRMVLVESFSQASCGPCAAQNPALETLLSANTTKAISIKYQVNWPGFDPMNLHNPTEIASRVSYYNVSGVPDRIIDGTNTDASQAIIDTRHAGPAPVTMNISHTINPDYTINVTVTITAPNVWNPSNTVLQLAMVEKEITFATAPGSNGETSFKNVMRKMYPNASGTPVVASNFSTAGGTQTFTFNNIAVPSYIYKMNQVRFIAWVQDNTTKEVHQAGFTEPQPVSNYGVVQSLSVPAAYNCENTISGATAVLSNQGNTTITTATVNYQLNGGTVQTAPFSGSIAPNGTANFSLPAMNVTTSGAQVITTYLTNINGSGINTPLGTQTIEVARVTVAGSTGQFVQNFSNTSFPYPNYYLTSPTGDNWNRATANSGCLRYAFYNFTSGKNGEVYLAPVNLASSTNKTMTFDVTYRQYQAENDRLQVMVSSDCGATWNTVYDKAGSTLATLPASTAAYNTPGASDWRNESISLASYANADKLIVKFKATSAYGNNVFVDNIMIGGALAIVEFEEIPVQMYPNPATETTTLAFEATGSYEVTLTDASGRVIQTVANTSDGAVTVELNVAGLTAGVYMVNIMSNGKMTTKSLIVG